jgi:hypothetical protein
MSEEEIGLADAALAAGRWVEAKQALGPGGAGLPDGRPGSGGRPQRGGARRGAGRG